MDDNLHGPPADEYHWLTGPSWDQARLDALCALYSQPALDDESWGTDDPIDIAAYMASLQQQPTEADQ